MQERMKNMLDLQKANLFKRISAGIFDFIILVTLAVGIMWAGSSLLNYGGYSDRLKARQDFFFEKYGIDFNISAEDYEKLGEEEKALYETASREFGEDKEARYVYSMMFNLILMIVTFSLLISYLLLEFVIPLMLKNGQTLGKKIFGIAVMRRDGVRVNGVLMFARTVLGKFTVGTMIPVLLAIMMYFGVMGFEGLIIIVGIIFIQIFMLAITKERAFMHDKLAQTVTVDMASQMIFDSAEELVAYKNKLQSEAADKAAY